jgi:tetratricopeptide (TPR) repeat protein
MFRLLSVMMLAGLLVACGPNVGKADSYEQLADNLVGAQAFPAAAQAMQKSIKYDSNEPRRWLKLGRIQRQMNQNALAAQSFQHALDLDPANIEGLENMAILEVRGGQYKEARSYVDPLLSLAPDDVAGLLAMGAIKMYQGDFIEANKYADQLIKVDPSGIGGYSLKAHVLESQGRPGAAAAVLAQQVALNPGNVDLALQVMDLYRKSGNRQGVRDTSLILSKLMPDDPRYKMESARALHAKGKDDEANAVIAGLQQQYRGNPDVIEAIAQYWFQTLPREAALAKVTAMIQALAGRSKAALGDMLTDEGRAADTVRLLAAASSDVVDQGNVEVHAAYARALLATGKSAQARKVAQDVLDFDSVNDEALYVHAGTSLAKRDFDGALTDAQLAVSSNPKNEPAALLIPQIYMAKNNPVMAEQAFGNAQNDNPDSTEIFQARMAWLVGQKRRTDAINIAGTFTHAHPRDVDAWRIYHQLCIDAGDRCAVKTAAQLKALGG